MIHKRELGNRISAIRKEVGYTQGRFAEMLGVSTQAVSKWENGQAIPDIEILLTMSKQYGITINEILEGRSIFPNIARPPIAEGDVTFFAPQQETDTEWAQSMIEEKWIKRNWEWHKQNTGHHEIAKRIVDHGGLILEIGTGPGGGNMPAVLKENPNAQVIISDISPTVVNEWKKFFSCEVFPPHVHFAVLDNCDLPFADHSLDVVSSGGGIGNIERGRKDRALQEVYRILKPGGLFVMGDGFVTQETLQTYPDPIQNVLKEKMPDIFEHYHEALISAGFKRIENILTGGWFTKDDESDVATLANQLGINLFFTSYVRYCTK